ncbi:uncharacterized protein LOC119731665 [Patiria miniata]|uniref:NTR domain-containing protein n=1 Tax=Patiria miniata TaxID=46514 RepID=A0A914AAK6_PATMI|nr:uncharacterized protein LOC119731665 [Patiria miniata]
MFPHLKILVLCILPMATVYGDSYDCQIHQDPCGCQDHPQEIVCEAQFVIKGKIVSKHFTQERDPLFGRIHTAHYEVNITTVFKGIGIVTSDNLIIQRRMEKCDRTGLDVGDNYIITGHTDFITGELRSHGCQWNAKWTKLTSFQQQGLINGAYLENCNSCEISTDLLRMASHGRKVSAAGKTCTFNYRSCEGQAHYKKRSCVRCGNQQDCSWVRNDRYENCYNTNTLPEILIY